MNSWGLWFCKLLTFNEYNFSSAQTAQVRTLSPQPASKCSPSRILTWETPVSPSNTGPAAWPARERLRCPRAGSSWWMRGSRTGSMRNMSGSPYQGSDRVRGRSPPPASPPLSPRRPTPGHWVGPASRSGGLESISAVAYCNDGPANNITCIA